MYHKLSAHNNKNTVINQLTEIPAEEYAALSCFSPAASEETERGAAARVVTATPHDRGGGSAQIEWRRDAFHRKCSRGGAPARYAVGALGNMAPEAFMLRAP